MKQISSEVQINASPERVWHLLTNFPAFPAWNPFMPRAEGELKPGARLKVYLKPPKGMSMTFKPRVLKVEPNCEFRWLGHFIMPGLFDGEHIFSLEPIDRNQTRFVQRELFRGLLVPFFSAIGLLRNTSSGFEAMNQALKSQAERSPGSVSPDP